MSKTTPRGRRCAPTIAYPVSVPTAKPMRGDFATPSRLSPLYPTRSDPGRSCGEGIVPRVWCLLLVQVGPTNRVSSVPPETEVRAPCPIGRNESVHLSVPLVRYEVFRDLRSLYSPPRGYLHASLLIPHRTSCSSQFENRWNSRSSSPIQRSQRVLQVHRLNKFRRRLSKQVRVDARTRHVEDVLQVSWSVRAVEEGGRGEEDQDSGLAHLPR